MTNFSEKRVAMVDCQVRPSDVTKFPIIDAMLQVPREAYVPTAKRHVAYAGGDIDLGNGRVVLDPRVLAKMLDVLDIQPDEMVMDLGCGFGYSTAVIARLAEAVVAVEDAVFAGEAESTLAAQSVDNAFVVEADLTVGAAKHGLYDVVIVEGAVEQIPSSIIDQIKDGGRIGAIFMDGSLGQFRVGIKLHGSIAWRFAFDASAPVLPEFKRAVEFVL